MRKTCIYLNVYLLFSFLPFLTFYPLKGCYVFSLYKDSTKPNNAAATVSEFQKTVFTRRKKKGKKHSVLIFSYKKNLY